MITVVDYGMGNLGSIRNMLKRIGAESRLTGDVGEIGRATKLILPGVGAFDRAMERIDASGMRAVLDRKALEERIPILGICLGMQLLTRGSEEGKLPGLGWIPATTRRFPANGRHKVPHMGWNLVRRSGQSSLAEGFDDDARFYFVHSYYVTVDRPENSMFKTTYAVEFDSAIWCGNIHGAQFHPEKSHRFGMRLLSNFAAL